MNLSFIFICTQEFDFYHHRANIVSLIMEKNHQLITSTQLVTQYDEVSRCGQIVIPKYSFVWEGVIRGDALSGHEKQVYKMLTTFVSQQKDRLNLQIAYTFMWFIVTWVCF